jgi:uncharacterized membrane protein YhaH (DUF805 family)
MAEHFKIVFEGRLRTGVDLETARLNLAQLFKSEVSAIDRLFSGEPITIKRGLTRDEAQRYLEALNDAGVEARLEAEQPLTLSLEEVDAPEPQGSGFTSAPASSPYAPPKASVANDWPAVAELKVLTLQGRIGRLRYLAWSLVLVLVGTVVGGICIGVMSSSLIAGGLLAAIACVAFVVVSIQIGAQRLHDAGWSAWLLLLNLVPVVGTFFPILMIVVPGNSGANQYGAPPPPNGKGVKVLAALWLLFLAFVFVSALNGGLKTFKEEVEATTSDYEQALPYDDDTATDQTDPADSSDTTEDQ